VPTLRLPLESQLFVAVTAALGTLFAVYVTLTKSPTFGVGLPLALLWFLTLVTAFLVWPHWAVALTIPYFALVPAAKIFITPWIGATKDVVSLSAVVASVLLVIADHRRFRADPTAMSAMGLLIVLYVVSVGGGHGVAWLQGVRLACLPMLMLFAGMTLVRPQRTLRWAVGSFAVTGCIIGSYGVLQQYLGVWRLHDLGYTYNVQLRTYHGVLRSFGTLDDPFAYAAFELMALAAVVFWMRRGTTRLIIATIIGAGIASSLVRSAALVSVGLFALWLARRGQTTVATLFVVALVASGVVFVVSASGTQTHTYQADSSGSVVTLNGRVSAWKAALGPPSAWPLGQGVGTVGTAAQRAAYSFTPAGGSGAASSSSSATAVDSGYLAVIADVGFIGFAVFAVLLGRLWWLGRRASRAHVRGAWMALAILVVMLIDASTRSSFTGFPTATLEFLMIGISLAAARDGLEHVERESR